MSEKQEKMKNRDGEERKRAGAQKLEVGFGSHGPRVGVTPGATLMEACDAAGVELASDCGGHGTCGKCLVRAHPSEGLEPLTEAEEKLLSQDQKDLGLRLACQAEIIGNLDLVEPAGGPVGVSHVKEKTAVEGEFTVKPHVVRETLEEVPRPRGEDEGRADLTQWLSERLGRELPALDPQVVRDLARPWCYGQEVTLVEDLAQGLTALLPGRRERSLGLAVDLGTTTVAAYLCDLVEGRILGAAGATNPQRRHGEDVISRIAHADREPKGLDQLAGAVRGTIDDLAKDLLAKAGAGQEDIDRVCLVGNTTMQQIFAGVHPHALGRAPYLPLTREPLEFRASELGLDLNPGTRVQLFPVISAYLGGDALAAVLAEGRSGTGSILIVDIGTNGELVLLGPKGAWATSCATGPALEGAHISAGVRAVDGAIHKVEDSPTGGPPVCRLIGGPDEKPLGLCGSGLIDAVAVLRRAGAILESGRFDDSREDVEKDDQGVGRSFTLFPAEVTKTGAAIRLSLQDIRQVQLAKAALYTGIEMLLQSSGVEQVDLTVLTGAFGAKFDWRNAAAIGLFPQEAVSGRVRPVVNAAGKGAVMALLDRDEAGRARDLAGSIRVLELSQDARFTMRFTEALAFPKIGG